MAPSPEQTRVSREQNTIPGLNRHSLSPFPLDMGQRKRQGLLHLGSAPPGNQSMEADYLPENAQLNRVQNVYLC